MIYYILLLHILVVICEDNVEITPINDKMSCLIGKANKYGFGVSGIILLQNMIMKYNPNYYQYYDWSSTSYSCCLSDSCINNGFDTIFNISFLQSNYNTDMNLPECPQQMNEDEIHTYHTDASYLFWNYNSDIQKIMDYELSYYDLFPKPLLVFQLRGGDKFVKETHPYNTTITVLKLSEDLNNYNGTCVIIGDDFSLSKLLAQDLEKYLNCYVMNRLVKDYSHFQEHFNSFSDEKKCELTRLLLVDIELSIKANTLVGLGGSNFIGLICLIRLTRGLSNSYFYDWDNSVYHTNKECKKPRKFCMCT